MGNVRVVHLEARQTFVYSVIPGDLALVEQGRKRRGGERFGVGTDPKESVLIHRRWVSHLAHAVALGKHSLSVFHDGHGQSGHLKRFQSFSNETVEIGGWSSLRRKNLDANHHENQNRE